MPDFKIFISASSGEFKFARQHLAKNMREADIPHRVQEDFGLSGYDLLKTLNTYIEECDAIVCLIGNRSGATPPIKAQDRFKKETEITLPEGLPDPSYTQWEFLLAKEYSKRIFAYFPHEQYRDIDPSLEGDLEKIAAVPTQASISGDVQQEAFIRYVNEDVHLFRGKPFVSCSDLGELVFKPLFRLDAELLFPAIWSQQHSFEQLLCWENLEFFQGRDWLFDETAAIHAKTGRSEVVTLVTAPPGAGKSSIAARFINRKPCGPCLAYSSFSVKSDVGPLLGFVRNLAAMLATNLEDFVPALRRTGLTEKCQAIHKAEVTEDQIKIFFLHAVLPALRSMRTPVDYAGKPAWIVVDALDEIGSDRHATDGNDKQIIYELLEQAAQQLPPWIRIFATSRSTEDAQKAIRNWYRRGKLVHHVLLDDRKDPKDAAAFGELIDAKLDKANKQISLELRETFLRRCEYNFLYLTHVLDGYLLGTYTANDIQDLPPGLAPLYLAGFRRNFPDATSDIELDTIIKPLLAALLTISRPLSFSQLGRVCGAPPPLSMEIALARLGPYLDEIKPESDQRESSYKLFHQSFSDWVASRGFTDFAPVKGDISMSEMGHALMAMFCVRSFEHFRIHSGLGDADWSYTLTSGVEHCLKAGMYAEAVELVHFIRKRWNSNTLRENAAHVAPLKLTRLLMGQLGRCSTAQATNLDVDHLIYLLQLFYQVEPLWGPVDLLVRIQPDPPSGIRSRSKIGRLVSPDTLIGKTLDWIKSLSRSAELLLREEKHSTDIRQKLLDKGHYVLRYVLSEKLASQLRIGSDQDQALRLTQTQEDLTSADFNLRELAAYTLRHYYVEQPLEVLLHPETIRCLENMGQGQTYAIRSALGDLMLSLCVPKLANGRVTENFNPHVIRSDRFWNPIWDHNRIDVWDIRAISPGDFDKTLSINEEKSLLEARTAFKRIEELRVSLLGDAGIKENKNLKTLLNDFYRLDRDSLKNCQDDIAGSKRFVDLIELIFSHPLWNIGELAAAFVVDEIQKDLTKTGIIEAFFDHSCWRVQFGAIEAAYQYASFDEMELFGRAVEKFYQHTNCRIRALCAENLIAQIIELPTYIRNVKIDESYGKYISAWLYDGEDKNSEGESYDGDAWVLEHIFRLFQALDGPPQTYDVTKFFRTEIPDLLAGLPRSGWGKVPRRKFLRRIEKRRGQQLRSAARVSSS